jgi:hypothetical protein
MKYNNAESCDALVKRGLICEIARRVVRAYDDEGRAVAETVDLPELNRGKVKLLKEAAAYDFA